MSCVSVIVPVRDGERFLAEALESALAQDHPPLEVLVVEDRSADGSRQVAGAFGPPVRVLDGPGRGPAGARNTGLAAARGDLIGFLDADDRWVPHKLALQVRWLEEHPEAACVLAGQSLQVEEGATPPEWVRRLGGRPLPPFAIGGLYRRKSLRDLRGFDPSYAVGEETDWLLRARAAGLRIDVLDRPLVVRRVHGDNLTYAQGRLDDALLRSVADRLRERRGGG